MTATLPGYAVTSGDTPDSAFSLELKLTNGASQRPSVLQREASTSYPTPASHDPHLALKVRLPGPKGMTSLCLDSDARSHRDESEGSGVSGYGLKGDNVA